MTDTEREGAIGEFHKFIEDTGFPCVAAKGALARNHVPCLVSDHFACPQEDPGILRFLYDFISDFRQTRETLYSAAIIFIHPEISGEDMFEHLLWQKLQGLSRLDAERFAYDPRVSPDPRSPDFSFSLGEEAFFVIGLHPASPRASRRFRYPAIVFNPHAQFETLRKMHRYEKMKRIVRERDMLFSGSVNPMLADFGEGSEARQYSGRQHGPDWECPLKMTHGETHDHPSAQRGILNDEKRPAPESH
jgi:FPC/CPF motif-containing protein YcgG